MTNDAPSGLRRMFELAAALPDQLLAGERLSGLAGIAPLRPAPRRVVLCGMGGSAIAGDLLAPLLAAQGVMLSVWRDYELPGWFAPDMLCALSSYSGQTEETLSAARAAAAHGGPLLCLTSGGRLLAQARAAAAAGRDWPAVLLPPGLAPRAALGYGLSGLLWALHRLGVAASPAAELAAAAATLRAANAALGAPAAAAGNEAGRLAALLRGRLAVIYTTSPEAHAAGWRLKAQLNENSKAPALVAAFPELNHNDIVGWRVPPARRDDHVLLLLRGGDEHPRTARRVEITKQLLAQEFPAIEEVRARGDCPLARIMSLVQLGDFLSCHLAAAAGVDPLPVERIDLLKQRLAEGEDS